MVYQVARSTHNLETEVVGISLVSEVFVKHPASTDTVFLPPLAAIVIAVVNQKADWIRIPAFNAPSTISPNALVS